LRRYAKSLYLSTRKDRSVAGCRARSQEAGSEARLERGPLVFEYRLVVRNETLDIDFNRFGDFALRFLDRLAFGMEAGQRRYGRQVATFESSLGEDRS
jgi:hypothetical protein